ncbi:MAG: hypothetical protein A4E38_01221 [Methanoregulaceae archaeon PtaB.Bin108]|jgi:polyhydroxyalkanoate synthesis regulator phasin|nr:MAG: hypothetical protein A4E38_01221 [Methanoregulaceae archaeon PtaB.Bin108]OPY46794.1 MAG: hypothetical protein A4E42_00401 [Methanoregulaceae archaeon PtaU1.Bin222]
MTTFETPGITGERHSFFDSLKEIPGYIDQRLPTMDKDLDRYFDQNLPAVIDEWGLVSRVHLTELERRLSRVHMQIDFLEKERVTLEARADRLEKELRKLEDI